MARMPRLWTPDSVNHVIVRGNRRQSTFVDELDYRKFLVELKTHIPVYKAVLYAYCLMPNHIHLLLKAALSMTELMHRVLTRYALYFNGRHEHVGHLFQDRFRSKIVSNDRYFSAVIPYIHFNPVKAQLASRPIDWAWSSAQEYAGLRDNGLVTVANRSADVPDINECEEEGNGFLRDPAMTLSFICREEARATGVSEELIRSDCSFLNVLEARERFISRAIAAGNNRTEIAAFLGCSPWTVGDLLRRSR